MLDVAAHSEAEAKARALGSACDVFGGKHHEVSNAEVTGGL